MSRLIIKSLFVLFLTLSTGFIFSAQAVAAEKQSNSNQQLAVLTVNINQASAEDISDVMTGVGINKAKVIVEYRDKNGAFKSIDQLLEVKGIGPATVEKNRHKLKL
ncbi:MAG: hypothetical protein COA74_07865 [Gammaproteobacteria bacterium]|nr:MAG: hypothetical protein COA74_07865 [Gammaproteobacteria bacterium]